MQKPPKKLLIGSHNPGKLKEYIDYFSQFPVELQDAASLSIPEPEETGETFEANALLKAQHSAMHANTLALGDDGGLMIHALEGFPGLRSARWVKEVGGFDAAFKELEKRLQGKSPSVTFECVVALYCPDSKESKLFHGRIDGHLAFPPQGDRSFGYDPIFVPEGHDLPFAVLGEQVKMDISHRAHCMKKVRDFLFG